MPQFWLFFCCFLISYNYLLSSLFFPPWQLSSNFLRKKSKMNYIKAKLKPETIWLLGTWQCNGYTMHKNCFWSSLSHVTTDWAGIILVLCSVLFYFRWESFNSLIFTGLLMTYIIWGVLLSMRIVSQSSFNSLSQ